jgi:hypothetical protein
VKPQQILAVKPDTGIIMLTMLGDNDFAVLQRCAPGAGLHSQRSDKAEVLKTIPGCGEWRERCLVSHCQ